VRPHWVSTTTSTKSASSSNDVNSNDDEKLANSRTTENDSQTNDPSSSSTTWASMLQEQSQTGSSINKNGQSRNSDTTRTNKNKNNDYLSTLGIKEDLVVMSPLDRTPPQKTPTDYQRVYRTLGFQKQTVASTKKQPLQKKNGNKPSQDSKRSSDGYLDRIMASTSTTSSSSSNDMLSTTKPPTTLDLPNGFRTLDRSPPPSTNGVSEYQSLYQKLSTTESVTIESLSQEMKEVENGTEKVEGKNNGDVKAESVASSHPPPSSTTSASIDKRDRPVPPTIKSNAQSVPVDGAKKETAVTTPKVEKKEEFQTAFASSVTANSNQIKDTANGAKETVKTTMKTVSPANNLTQSSLSTNDYLTGLSPASTRAPKPLKKPLQSNVPPSISSDFSWAVTEARAEKFGVGNTRAPGKTQKVPPQTRLRNGGSISTTPRADTVKATSSGPVKWDSMLLSSSTRNDPDVVPQKPPLKQTFETQELGPKIENPKSAIPEEPKETTMATTNDAQVPAPIRRGLEPKEIKQESSAVESTNDSSSRSFSSVADMIAKTQGLRNDYLEGLTSRKKRDSPVTKSIDTTPPKTDEMTNLKNLDSSEKEVPSTAASPPSAISSFSSSVSEPTNAPVKSTEKQSQTNAGKDYLSGLAAKTEEKPSPSVDSGGEGALDAKKAPKDVVDAASVEQSSKVPESKPEAPVREESSIKLPSPTNTGNDASPGDTSSKVSFVQGSFQQPKPPGVNLGDIGSGGKKIPMDEREAPVDTLSPPPLDVKTVETIFKKREDRPMTAAKVVKDSASDAASSSLFDSKRKDTNPPAKEDSGSIAAELPKSSEASDMKSTTLALESSRLRKKGTDYLDLPIDATSAGALGDTAIEAAGSVTSFEDIQPEVFVSDAGLVHLDSEDDEIQSSLPIDDSLEVPLVSNEPPMEAALAEIIGDTISKVTEDSLAVDLDDSLTVVSDADLIQPDLESNDDEIALKAAAVGQDFASPVVVDTNSTAFLEVSISSSSNEMSGTSDGPAKSPETLSKSNSLSGSTYLDNLSSSTVEAAESQAPEKDTSEIAAKPFSSAAFVQPSQPSSLPSKIVDTFVPVSKRSDGTKTSNFTEAALESGSTAKGKEEMIEIPQPSSKNTKDYLRGLSKQDSMKSEDSQTKGLPEVTIEPSGGGQNDAKTETRVSSGSTTTPGYLSSLSSGTVPLPQRDVITDPVVSSRSSPNKATSMPTKSRTPLVDAPLPFFMTSEKSERKEPVDVFVDSQPESEWLQSVMETVDDVKSDLLKSLPAGSDPAVIESLLADMESAKSDIVSAVGKTGSSSDFFKGPWLKNTINGLKNVLSGIATALEFDLDADLEDEDIPNYQDAEEDNTDLDTAGMTERIMHRIPVETQATGAGGVSTYEAFQRAEANWSRLKAFDPSKIGPKPPAFVTDDGTAGNPKCWAKLREQHGKNLDYDVVVCGGTLGIFFAMSLRLQGHRVCVLEAGKLRGREQEWNISMEELLELKRLGVLTQEDIDAAIKTQFPGCRSGFKNREITPLKAGYKRNGIGYECVTNDVLNLGVSPAILLERVAKRFVELGGVIKEETRIEGVVVSEASGSAVDLGGDSDPITARLVIDSMGNASPISRQQRWGMKPDGVCAVVGSCASGFKKEDNLIGDIIYTNSEIQDKGENGKLQYFWEAFPVNIGRDGKEPGTSDVKTTYMFTYMDADQRRPSLETLMEDYWKLLPKYQPSIKNPETDLDFKRVLFAYFPTYRASPLKPQWSRVLAVGDASGIQSPLSFGGFGALTRHLDRITGAVSEALENDCLHKDDLAEINAYTPNLSAAWMFQKAMSVRVGQDIDPKFINRLLAVNFQVMDKMGERTIKPFLQDVVRFDGLIGSLARSFAADPTFMPQIVQHVGIPTLIEWMGHVGMMGLYGALDTVVSPVMKTVILPSVEDPKTKFQWKRRLEAWKYGSGNDYVFKDD